MAIHHEIVKSAERIRPYIRRPPFNSSASITELIDTEVWFKLESLQVTGSFKARGAVNKLLSLSTDEREYGVVSASTGNHGAAVAYGAQKLGLQCTIYVPQDTSPAKLENMGL